MSRKVFLLEPYQEHQAGETISVSQNVAYGLVEGGIGRFATSADSLVRPEFGATKAFDSPPSRPMSRSELRRQRRKVRTK